MRKYELDTMYGLSHSSWLVTREEIKRWNQICREVKKSKPDVLHQMVLESLIRCHIWEQRLVDRRYFWNGDRTTYCKTADHEQDIDTEDLDRKQKEWDRYFPLVTRYKMDLLKLALANSIDLSVTGDVTQLFSALDKTTKQE